MTIIQVAINLWNLCCNYNWSFNGLIIKQDTFHTWKTNNIIMSNKPVVLLIVFILCPILHIIMTVYFYLVQTIHEAMILVLTIACFK